MGGLSKAVIYCQCCVLCTKIILNTFSAKLCMSQLLQLLLDHGAHLDQPNRAGDCPAIFVAMNPLNNVHLVNYVTLRCLAATAVCKYKIPYEGQIPATLETFVKFHEE
jgi:hypothetical protein